MQSAQFASGATLYQFQSELATGVFPSRRLVKNSQEEMESRKMCRFRKGRVKSLLEKFIEPARRLRNPKFSPTLLSVL
jgi:hypothetical protein